MEELPNHNTGLINEFSPSVWLGGNIPYEVRLESGNWLPFDVVHEKQKDPVEVMACVTFSLLNNFEIQHKFKGIDINLSDRFTAKASDTQMNGNTFERVADSTRHTGVVREETYPNNPKAQTWAEYYKEIPQDVLKKAVKVDFNYEIIPRVADWSGQLQKYLKQCPLWITIPEPHPNHAVTLLRVVGNTAYIKDHYSQAIRTIKVSDISIAAKVVLNKLIQFNMNQTKIVLSKDGKTVYKAVPIATDFENFKKQASIEGIEVPNPIPPASEL